ncbi:autotransporter assembly complex protein TamA [Tolumonas osonensis]|uniref:Translocation and assembly module subunit TamA n=1 Tax=Tolumonas osonensis TaxID=675874 RepID=A0A841GE81_9GAMM|nr:autotransporter assembly complex family protein [Tolumonas osonensis]MBB6055887.1 translocation and assembly module TamA [Tolumonas osonensis]
MAGISPVCAAPVTYDVRGVKGELLDNVEYYLAALPAIDSQRVEGREKKITEAIRKSLQAVGYYSPKINFKYPAEKSHTLQVEIEPGKPVKVRQIQVELHDDAQKDADFLKILSSLDLETGAVLHHGKYENIKRRLKTLAATHGYFDAKIVRSDVQVYPRDEVADIHIVFNSGHRYRFGAINIDGIPQTKLIQPLLRFKQGDAYDTRKLAELSQSLSQTRYFQVVDVHPQISQAEDYRIPVTVHLEKKKPNQMETGLGFSTDEGPRVQWNWERPWVNDYGHRFSSQIKIAQTTQTVDFSYRIPNKNPIDDYYQVQTTYENVAQDDTRSQKIETGLHYWTTLMGQWQRDYFFKTAYEKYEQGEDSGNSLLFMPGASITRVRSKGGIDPYWGDLQTVSVMFSDPLWASDTRFVKVWGRTKWLRTYASNHRFIFRAEQGALLWGNLSEIPASQRFFTGGDQTVRGFGYETISPIDSSGQLSGALNTTAGSLEYNYQIAPKWRIATFVDVGTATNDYQDPWKIGTGIGGRWLTPVGQLRFDLAFGVSEQSVPFRLHFALGPEL